jgi:hypothetical protein
MRNWVWLGLVAGCVEDFVPSAYESAQLAQASVLLQNDDDQIEGTRRDWAGPLAVDGDGNNFELTVSGPSSVRLDLYTPSNADLTVLGGLDVSLSLAPEAISGELSMSISDDAGDLVYLLEPVGPGLLTTERFGPGMLAPATDLGTAPIDGWNMNISSYYMRTDSGDVELYPGEPQEVTLGGSTYRAVLLAGFTSERVVDANNLECFGPTDRTAFELLRVDAGTADTAALTRDENLPAPLATCFNTR